jgi:carbonic anhydrase
LTDRIVSAVLRWALGFAVSSALLGPTVFAAQEGHWTYQGAEGPEHWGELDQDSAICASGRQQSPIDLAAPVSARLEGISLSWNTGAWSVTNNGHTLQVNTPDGGSAIIDGEAYELTQFHFHTPSEHTIDGVRSALEAHFVHANANGDLAVIGVMMQPGQGNDLFSRIMTAAPRQEGERPVGSIVNPRELISATEHFLRYQGSLTTPPCSEIVVWTVLETPVTVSQSDIDAFAALFPMNARPLQDAYRRFILTSD